MKGHTGRLVLLTDPFTTEIRYHHKCYTGPYQRMSAEEKLSLMHDVNYCEVQTMFIDHVCQFVPVDHEIITLKGCYMSTKTLWEHMACQIWGSSQPT